MADMQNMMKMMRQNMHGGNPIMGQGGMMGPGMGMHGGKMLGNLQRDKMTASQGGMPADMMEMMKRQQMMEQRMDMMQMMMDQMMQNQAAMEETRMIQKRRHDHRKTK
jgi:hypothetical protein